MENTPKAGWKKIWDRVSNPESNFFLWILILAPVVLGGVGALIVKMNQRPPAVVLQPGVTTPELKKIAEDLEPPNPDEGLHVIAYTTVGEVSRGVEGIKVLFDHSMIPMTEVDPDKHPTIPMTIVPAIPGQFVWYGTKGFVYQFQNSLPPATTFKVTLPKNLTALDKKSLGKDFTWEFYTSNPKVSAVHPRDQQQYLAPSTLVKIAFSQAMNHAAVEKAFKCQILKAVQKDNKTTYEGEDCNLTFRFRWENDPKGGEILIAQPDKGFSLDTYYSIELPSNLAPKEGDRGSDGFQVSFYTAGPMQLDLVEITHPFPNVGTMDDLVLYRSEPTPTPTPEPQAEAGAPTRDGVVLRPTGDLCFTFSNPISRASFESAVQIIPLGSAKADPNFKPNYFYENKVYTSDEAAEEADTPADLPHRTGCIGADMRFNNKYEVRLTKPVTDRLGQAIDLKKLPFPVKFDTMHAALEVKLNITKTMFNAKKLPGVPFTSINAERVDVRLIPCQLDMANMEGSDAASCIQAYNDSLNAAVGVAEDGGQAEPTPSAEKKKDPLLREIPIPADYDVYYNGRIDLASLYTDLKPGFYAIEAVFHPMSEITLKKKIKKWGVEQDALLEVAPITATEKILLSETALAMKAFENQFLIWAVDIATGEPRSNLPILVWKDTTLTASGYTDDEGIFRFVNNTVDLSDYQKVYVVVDDPKAFGYLSSEDKDGIAPDSFGYSYERSRNIKSYFAFLHSDRPLYRPNQNVYFSGFLRGVRDGVYRLPSDLSEVQVSITDPVGYKIFDKKLPLSATGTFGDQVTLGDQDIPRGQYRLTATVPTYRWDGSATAQSFSKMFYVASYKKPDFKVSLTPDKPEVLSGELLKLTAKGSYFFGGPLANAEIDWSIRQEGFRFAPVEYPEYLFVDEEAIQKTLKLSAASSEVSYEEDEYYEGDGIAVTAGVYSTDSDSRFEDPKIKVDVPPGPQKIGGSTLIIPAKDAGLGPDGLFVIDYTPNLAAQPTSQIYTAVLNAKEWGQEVSTVSDVKVHKSSVYVGVKPERAVFNKGEALQFDLLTLTPEAKPVARQAIQLQLYKREYMTVKKRTDEGKWVFESEPKDTLVGTTQVTSDGSGKAAFTHRAEQGGAYRLVATTEDPEKRSMSAAVEVGVGGEPDAPFKKGSEDRIALIPDKPSYKVGETAQVLVPFSTGGLKALMTVERGGVREHQLIRFDSSDNFLKVPIKEEYVPNIYVSLLLFRPQGTESALMKVGLAELKVEPERKKLAVTITPEKEKYAPKEKVRLNIRTVDASGKGTPADLIVSVADESVLRLVDYQSPDLLKRFYFPRKLGVYTAENMLHYKSGDSGSEVAADMKKRSKFLDTAFFNAQLRTDANGQATAEFELPDNLTTWVAETFAVSETTEVGSIFTSFKTVLPTFVRPSLPRFLAVEDAAQPIVFVENTTETPFQGSLTIQVSGDAGLTGEAKQDVKVEAESRSKVPFGITGLKKGEAKISVRVSDGSGQASDVMESTLPIWDRSEPVIFSAGGATREKAVEQLSLPQGIRRDRGDLRVSVGTSPMKIMQEALNYLLEFPYGCAEQRTSALLGLWQLSSLAKNLQAQGTATVPAPLAKIFNEKYKRGDQALKLSEIQTTMETGLAAVYAFQKGDGGFSFWEEETVSDVFLSAEMSRAFRLFKENGVGVDASSQSKLGAYLANILGRQAAMPRPPPGKPDMRQFEGDSRSVLVWGLGKIEDKRVTAAVDSLLEMQDVLGPRGLASLALGIGTIRGDYQSGDVKDLVKRLRKKVVLKESPQGELASWYDPAGVWDQTTTSAVAMQALLAYDPDDELVEKTARYLISKARRGNFGHTQATREALIALWQYSSAPRKEKMNVATTLNVADKTQTQELPAFSLTHWLEEVLPIDRLPESDKPFDVQIGKPVKAPGALYYQATLTSYFPMPQVPRREDGLILAREFYAMSDLKEEKPLQSFQLGENYKVSLTLLVPKTLSQLTVEHLLPAGFDPVDFELSTSNPELAQALQESLEAEQKSPVLLPSAFGHEEIHDDRVMWYGARVGFGIYKIRHVVRASTVGQFQAPGATAFPFYDTNYFARSRSMIVEVKEGSERISKK